MRGGRHCREGEGSMVTGIIRRRYEVGDRREKSKYQRTDGEHEKRLKRMEVKYPSS